MLFRTNDGSHLFEWDRRLGYQVRILRDGFLVQDKNLWHRVDPETGELTRFEPIHTWERLLGLLTDGSLLVISKGRLLLVDVATGNRSPMSMKGSGASTFLTQAFSRDSGETMRNFPIPADEPLVAVLTPKTSGLFLPARLALLDFATKTVHLQSSNAGYCPRIVWSDGTQALVIEDRKRLVKHNLTTGERRVLAEASQF